MTIGNITSGFRNTGVCPYNPDAILDKVPQPTVSSSEESDAELDHSSDKEERFSSDSTQHLCGRNSPDLQLCWLQEYLHSGHTMDYNHVTGK